MKKKLSKVIVGIFVTVALALAEDSVYIPDSRLKTAVEQELQTLDPTPTDMLDLLSLNAAWSGIGDLKGLEYALNLRTLDVSQNNLKKISVLAGLTRLRTINLNNNPIVDFSPLSNLPSLSVLDVHDNRIRGIRRIDIGFLSGMTNLTRLTIRDNRIRDISVLSELINLDHLDIGGNLIQDLSPLLNLTKLSSLRLGYNPLSEDAYCSFIPQIISNNLGMHVSYRSPDHGPTEVTASRGTHPGKVVVSWSDVCGGPSYTAYYRVYRAREGDFEKIPVSDWARGKSNSFEDADVATGVTYTYWIRAAFSRQGLNPTDFSPAAEGWAKFKPSLTLSSTPGGSVVTPGEGTFEVEAVTHIRIEAVPQDNDLFAFLAWQPAEVGHAHILELNHPQTWVFVRWNSAIKAQFVTKMDTLYVDDHAFERVPDGNTASSDPYEDGTALYPFNTIQKAIDVAVEGSTVVVGPGVYRETLNFLGKNIHVLGDNMNGDLVETYPVIQGHAGESVIKFVNGEDSRCLLSGFVITGGEGEYAGAVLCDNSSPVLSNCLIVGNRVGDANSVGAAIYCVDSSARIVNCSVVDNHGSGICLIDSNLGLKNSIVWGNFPSQILVASGDNPDVGYSNIEGSWEGRGNFNLDPLFVMPGYWSSASDSSTAVLPADPNFVWVQGDYHLKSQTGHWSSNSQTWVLDESTSPCIDAGDPVDFLGQEPAPHGGVINMGTYGGSVEGSKSI